MKVARLPISAIALTLVMAACGDDAVEPEDVLTEEEAVSLFKSRSSLTSFLQGGTADTIHNSTDSTVFGCPQGGQVKLVLNEFKADTTLADTARFIVDGNVTPSGCKLTGDGLQFTLDGDPSVREYLELKIFGLGEVIATGSVNGGLKWKLEDRSGSCEMDMTMSGVPDFSDPDNPKLVNTYKGSLCGHQVEIATTEDIVEGG